MLEKYGVSAEAESAYLAMPAGSPCEVVTFTDDVPGTRVAAVLGELRECGLATESDDGRWQATAIGVALPALANRRIDSLEEAARSAHALSMAAAGQESEQFEIITSAEAQREFLEKVCATAWSIRSFDAPPYALQRDEHPTVETLRAESPEWQVLERGGDIKTVYHPGFSQHASRRRETAVWIAHGEQARWAPVPMKLSIVDHDTIHVPSLTHHRAMEQARSRGQRAELRVAVMRGNSVLTEVFNTLFEQTWMKALPLAIGNGRPVLDEKQQTVAKMLLHGESKTAIADELAVSNRTVDRVRNDLELALGTRTPYELGATLQRMEDDGLLDGILRED